MTLDDAAAAYRAAKTRFVDASARSRWAQDDATKAAQEVEEAKVGLERAHEQLLIAANGGVADAVTMSRGRLGRVP